MSWFSENKFLAGFIGATVIGVGGMGWFTLSAKNKHTAAVQEYESAKSELQALQEQKPFPKSENLKLVEAEKAATLASIHKLQSELAASGFPAAEMSASEFQIELKKTLDDIAAKSAKVGMALPKEKFDLGFDYLGGLPDQAAAKSLGRELKAIAWVANKVLEGGAVQLDEVKREKIEEEKEPPKVVENKKGAPAKKEPKEEKKLTRHDTFEITFKAEQGKARKILNDIVACKEQFYIPRRIRFENESLTGPSKVNPTAAQPGATPPDGNAEAPKAAGITPVLGQEKVTVSLELEAVYFTAPEVKPAKKTSNPEAH